MIAVLYNNLILYSSNYTLCASVLMNIFYLHFHFQHAALFVTHSPVYFKDLINWLRMVYNIVVGSIYVFKAGAKTFGQWYRWTLMKCILLYNIQRFGIQPLSAIFNTRIAITIIPSADDSTLNERKKIELGPMVIHKLLLFRYV